MAHKPAVSDVIWRLFFTSTRNRFWFVVYDGGDLWTVAAIRGGNSSGGGSSASFAVVTCCSVSIPILSSSSLISNQMSPFFPCQLFFTALSVSNQSVYYLFLATLLECCSIQIKIIYLLGMTEKGHTHSLYTRARTHLVLPFKSQEISLTHTKFNRREWVNKNKTMNKNNKFQLNVSPQTELQHPIQCDVLTLA